MNNVELPVNASELGPARGPTRVGLAFLLLGCLGVFAAPRVCAQERDSVRVSDGLPALHQALDLAELLGEVPGTFLYRFAAPGWPDGWSYHGLPPQRAATTLNDLPFSHVFTGRPGFDVAPTAFVARPAVETARLHRPATVGTRLRSFASAGPITEIKYWKGAAGLESIDAVHAQHRSRSLFGNPGALNVMGSYSGRGASGVYPGSRLRRGRQVQLRLQYGQRLWAVEVLNVHTRRTIGAHGGVIPEDSGFESVYATVGAIVENPRATRRIVRNDLHASSRLPVLGAPITVSGFWTAETFRYRDEVDTVGTSADRLGFRVALPIVSRPGRSAGLELDGWAEQIAPRLRYVGEPLRRSELHVAVRDSFSVLGWDVQARLSAHTYDGSVHPGGRIEVAKRAAALRFFAGGTLSGEPPSPVELMGFRALGAAPDDRSGRIADTFVGASWSGGTFDLRVRVHGSRTSQPRDVYMTTDYMTVPDSAAVLFAPSAAYRAGAAVDLGWRRDAEIGLYAILQPSLVTLLNRSDAELHERVARALPEWFGRARIGARRLLFRGDLDLDAFAEAYVWSTTAGRALHPETGLLAVPLITSRTFGPSSMINVGAEAGVRDATFFFIFQNVLAGTKWMTGNLIVPVYPLPPQQFRFGVYWPIFN